MDLDSFVLQSFSSQLILVYLAGVGTSFTPCVYPLIPITLALFGARENPSHLRALLLSSCFVLGLAVTFTTLGVAAALTGTIFGGILGSFWVALALALLLFTLALSNLGIFSLPLFSRVQTWASKIGGKGPKGAFLAGMACGPVAAPCVGPILVPLLALVAAQHQVARGSLLLFTYALGVGTLFLVLGTFSSLLSHLPKSGRWLLAVKFTISVVLCVLAIDFLSPHLPGVLQRVLHSRTTGVVAILLAWATWLASALRSRAGIFERIARLLLLAVGIWSIFFSAPRATEIPLAASHQGTATDAPLQWMTDFTHALEKAKTGNTPLIVDFSAEWCAACKELEHKTFSDPNVKKLLRQATLVRVDFTVSSDESDALSERYGVVGLPWVFVASPEGELIEGSVVTGFLDPQKFMAVIQPALMRARDSSSDSR